MFDDICVGNGSCDSGRAGRALNPVIERQTPAPVEAAREAPARVVTLEDVARYVPVDAELQVEPSGWAVVGVPANFWTQVEPRVVRAQLLGDDADVRFTPELYRWNHGDGTEAATETAGSSWAALGQQDYSATATSYVYREKATVNVSVTIVWSAEYRVAGSSWTPIAGAVTSNSSQRPLLVVRERTVLTAG